MTVLKTIRLLALLMIAGLVLAGCGRAGDPLKPSEAAIERAKEAKKPPPPSPLPNKDNPDKRFILDGLLE